MLVPADQLDIAVRAYAVPKTRTRRARPNKKRVSEIGPSEWSLIYDTETTTGPEQQVRIVPWQLRQGGELRRVGMAYDPRSLSDAERSTLYLHAAVCGWEVCTVAEFVEDIFLGDAYQFGARFVAFNDPFDLARLAIGHDSARGDTMRGGFSLQLSPDKRRPRVQVRHLNSREALRRFTAPPKQRTPRGMRRRGLQVPAHRGAFVDAKTIGDSLTGQSHTLASLAKLLRTPHQKMETHGHGETLTPEYLDYAMTDVQATSECFDALDPRYATFGLTGTPLHQIYSEASIGKAHIKEMGIRRWRDLQPECPPELIGIILSTYYGGRADVRLRRWLTRVLYCDFKSMYPSVCVLMGLWRFVVAERMAWEDVPPQEIQAFLDHVTPADLQCPDVWRQLCVLVQVEPDEDLFPTRAQYERLFPAPAENPAGQYTIGLNYLTCQQPLWFTLADCIVAKLLTGKAPRVRQARRFAPVGVQRGLRPIDLMGDPAFRIDPAADDFYRRLIDLRSQVKARQKAAEAAGDEALAAELEAQQQMLKLIANATSYGIFIELNVTVYDRLREVTVYGPSGDGFSAWVRNVETPGTYFHPLLATLITGAARLMLALAEARARAVGVDWAYCDTDSLALARPDGMDDADFVARCRQVFEWFTPLNPYEEEGLLFEIESENYRLENGKPSGDLEELFCWAVSPKRAWLFNIDSRGRPVLRRASAHGLGHLVEPYREQDAPRRIPKPAAPLQKLGVKRWQYDLGYRLVEAALQGHPNQVRLDDLPGFDKPAASRYAATTPHLLRWFRSYNRGRPYREQVRPFGFMHVFQHRGRSVEPVQEGASVMPDGNGRGARRRKAVRLVRPVAPFHKDPSEAAKLALNRESERGESVPVEQLAGYREALAQYHLHPEAKYLGADFLDRGATRLRHILARSIHQIGKEANRWEEQFYLGIDPGAQIEYGAAPEDVERLRGDVLRACRALKPREIARESGLSPAAVSAVLGRSGQPTAETLHKLLAAAAQLQRRRRDDQAQSDAMLAAVRDRCQTMTVRQFAIEAGVHYGHLTEVLAGRRKLSRTMLLSLEAQLAQVPALRGTQRMASPPGEARS
jgi:hypothetical protein